MKSLLRKSLTLWAWALVLAVPGLTNGAQGPDIVETATGRSLSVSELADQVKGADVIFFGEFHDNTAIHELEAALFEALYERKGRNLALSLEMAEQDSQPVLDAYLKGEVPEETYLAQSRPWPNYREAYRPAVEFAKTHDLSVVAASIPRRLRRRMPGRGRWTPFRHRGNPMCRSPFTRALWLMNENLRRS